jgi:hypothetical protein
MMPSQLCTCGRNPHMMRLTHTETCALAMRMAADPQSLHWPSEFAHMEAGSTRPGRQEGRSEPPE